jgi:hypothetical protein
MLPAGSAWQTIDMAGRTRLLCGLAATLEKSHEHRPMKERRSLPVDRLKTLLHPCADRVFVKVKKAGDLFHSIRTMKLHKPGIGMTLAHSPRLIPLPKLSGAVRRCALAPMRPNRLAGRAVSYRLCGKPARRRQPPIWQAKLWNTADPNSRARIERRSHA